MINSRRATFFVRERLPHLYLLLRALRYGGGEEPLDPQSAAILETLCAGEPKVLSGPFAGMRYLTASDSDLLPKIVGCYEMEIHGAVAASLRRGYRRIVNVGCGEGYYAVGYTRALPAAEVFAFDPDVLARSRLRTLARLNGVAERIRIAERCRPERLDELAGEGCLVVCDCEGCERDLLDPQAAPALAHTDLLVEVHDFQDPSLSRLLAGRFIASHEVLLFGVQPRDDYPLPLLDRLPAAQRSFALWEERPELSQWAWMRALSW